VDSNPSITALGSIISKGNTNPGGAVLYKTAYQATIAQSSTEAEFTAAADAAKYILSREP